MIEFVTGGAPPRVILASAAPDPPALAVLRAYGIEPIWLHTPPGRPMAYYLGLRMYWQEFESFILVEGDILPWPGALETLWQCSCIYGGFGYMMGGGFDTVAFGCTKFTKPLMEAFPALLEEPPLDTLEQQERWDLLDSNFAVIIRRHGIEACLHWPPVVHLNMAHQDPTRKIAVRPDVWARMGRSEPLEGER